MQYCTFYLDHLLFGIEVLKVQEIVYHQELTPVPLAPKGIKGLMNLRGQIITVVDLKYRLGLQEESDQKTAIHLIVKDQEEWISFLVDEIGDIQKVDEGDLESPPENLKKTSKQFIDKVYKLQDRLLLVLNSEKVLYPEKISNVVLT